MRVLMVAGGLLLLGLILVLVFSLSADSDKGQVFAAAVLTSAAALVVGALLGSLFALPRYRDEKSPGQPMRSSRLTVKVNLEQISDWLTKILVGVGLIELGKIGPGLGSGPARPLDGAALRSNTRVRFPGSHGVRDWQRSPLILVDKGDSWHLTFGETFRIVEVPDDPALPSWERKGTDTLHFNLTKGGIETFTEAYHDSGSNDDGKNIWTIRYYRTFVATEDGVRFDREVIVFPFLEC